jgi:hypothetical protein
MGTHITQPIRMKTTIEISDPLMMQARQHATRQGTTLRSLVEQGLRTILADKQQVAGFRLRRASFKGNGLQPEILSASWDRLREMAYEGHGG